MPRKLTAARNASSTLPAPQTPDGGLNLLALLPASLPSTFSPAIARSPARPSPPSPPPPAAAVAPLAARRQRILLREKIGGCFVSHLRYVWLMLLLLLYLLKVAVDVTVVVGAVGAVRLLLLFIRDSLTQVPCRAARIKIHTHICYLTSLSPSCSSSLSL